ncbi:MAG: lysophospholipid acyltransferase family protein [Acidobacteriota bacterium]
MADAAAYVLIRSFVTLVGLVPRSLAYLICETIAALVYFLDQKHRRIGTINLRIAFPEKSDSWRRRVLRQSFQQVADQVVELSRIPRLNAAKLAGRVRYEEGCGLEHYRRAKEQGKGVLFLTAHVSAWELLPTAHALYGHPLSFVVRPLDNPYLDRWAQRLRSRVGNQVLAKQGSILRIMRILKRNGDIGFLIDQNVQEKDGVFAPFFDRPACTTSSLAALALRSEAPVVPGFIYPMGRRGLYRIRFYPPLQVVRTGDQKNDLIENTAIYNQYIEQVIREFPHCWLWGHRRFRTQPDGSNLYR